jgi:predicted glutamine amidotransferase
MCRMLAISSEPADPVLSRDHISSLFRMAREHPHGWGLVHYEDGGPVLVKMPVRADRSLEAMKAVGGARSTTVMGHIRNASIGGRTLENTHPFVDGHWAFCHNGTIDVHSILRQRLGPERRQHLKGETDSEVLFQWLLQNMEECGDTAQGLEDAVRAIVSIKGPSTSSLDFMLSDGLTLYAYNLAFKRHHYFALHWTEIDDPNKDSRSVIICSEPMGGSGLWRRMENDTLAIVRDGRPPQFRSLL